MKIVFLNPAAQGGGAEQALYDLVLGLRDLHPDWEFHVILGEAGPLDEKLAQAPISREVLAFPENLLGAGEQPSTGRISPILWIQSVLGKLATIFSLVGYSRRMRRRLRQINPQIVYTNGMKMHLIGALTRPKKARLVWHLHDYISSRRMTSHLLPKLSRKVSLVIANSKSVAADIKKILPSAKVETLYNAVDLHRFSPFGEKLDLDQLSDLTAAPSGTIRVGLVATFARWKGQDLFLQALALLPTNMAARFYIIGGPVYATASSQWTMKELNNEVQRLGLAERVGLTGWVPDAALAMRSLDIVVHASTKPEPFGLVIIQAMACGKPILISNEGGAAELLETQAESLKYTPRDAQSLADCLTAILHAPAKRIALAESGLAYVRDHFDRVRMATTASQYLENVISSPC